LLAQEAGKYKIMPGGVGFWVYNEPMIRSSWLVVALRETAHRLQREDTPYKWAHFGQCNCGHLAQTLTRLPAHALQRAAELHQGDWSEQAITWEKNRTTVPTAPMELPDYGDRPALDEGAWEPEGVEYCTTTYLPMADVLQQLGSVGLKASDLVHLERLSDPRIRKHLGTNTQDFHYANREHLIQYLLAWAELEEREMQLEASGFSYSLAAE
jgi:hypothetical protein